MSSAWGLTAKRRENIAKACLNALTVDLSGLVAPFFLPAKDVPANILASGIVVGITLLFVIYLIDL